jgi:hypothetical protein
MGTGTSAGAALRGRGEEGGVSGTKELPPSTGLGGGVKVGNGGGVLEVGGDKGGTLEVDGDKGGRLGVDGDSDGGLDVDGDNEVGLGEENDGDGTGLDVDGINEDGGDDPPGVVDGKGTGVDVDDSGVFVSGEPGNGMGAELVVSGGDPLGWRDVLPPLAESLVARGMRYGGTVLEAGLLPNVGGVLGDEVLVPIGVIVPVPVGLIPVPPMGEVVAGVLGAFKSVPSDGVPVEEGVIPTPVRVGCVEVGLGDAELVAEKRGSVGTAGFVEPLGEVGGAAGFGPVFDVAGVAWSFLPDPSGINGVPVPPLSVALVRTIEGEAGEETELVDGLGPEVIGFGIVEFGVPGQVEEVDLSSFFLGLERGV